MTLTYIQCHKVFQKQPQLFPSPYLTLAVWFCNIFHWKVESTSSLLESGLDLCWFANWPSCTEGKERWKKEADHFRLVGRRFNKQGKLQDLSWAAPRPVYFHVHFARIVNVYTDTLTGFNHIHCPDGLKNIFLSQGIERGRCCWKQLLLREW